MFCFKCGASMPDESTVCPQCAAPVQAAPPPAAQSPQAGGTPPVSTSAWLNPPSAQTQYPAQGQYPSQAQPYGGQNQPPSIQQTDGKATASLVLGILSFFCFSVLTGIPAIILGHMSKANIRRSMGRLKGEGMATAGLVMGYISATAIPLLILAAIAIPNLLRAKISANESTAASTIRTINTAQVSYQTKYPEKGYAPDLATLGSGSNGACTGEGTAEHACLIGGALGSANCTSGVWCQKDGYRFTIIADCGASAAQQGDGTGCKEFVSTAMPISSATGRHSFCSVSDAIVRIRREGPLPKPPTAEECGEWPPIS
jgi:type IV pilus assembly protein PilA